MKEIAKFNGNSVQHFNFFDSDQFATMQRVSKMFSMSELVPDMYKASDKVTPEKAMANCMIALSLAQRMGADPLMVMQNLIIIYGRPSWSSKFLISTVNTCGRFETLKYEFKDLGKIGKIEITEYEWNPATRKKEAKTVVFDGSKMDNIQCVAYTKEKGSDERLESSEVTIKMAIEEGWYTKNGSKWKTMPKKMLIYRAASFWTNEYAPEISMGMKTEEEAWDIEDVAYEDISDKVDNDINKNANKQPMSFDDAPENDQKQENPEEKQPEKPLTHGEQKMPDIFNS
ncbi:hypothetical protein [Albibacterium profundi]|uniref:Recombinase RecT n=1 Tax=Albibacterium profundi TaxID=3134906 RepID=A0ABV5CEV6_9SPHI